MLHTYLFFFNFSQLHSLLGTYTLINFRGKFLPTLLKRVGKIIFYLVPTRLLGPTRLLNSNKFSHPHGYSGPTFIRHLRVLINQWNETLSFLDWSTDEGLSAPVASQYQGPSNILWEYGHGKRVWEINWTSIKTWSGWSIFQSLRISCNVAFWSNQF